MTLLLSKSEVGQHLVMEELIEEMEIGFSAFARGKINLPQRTRLSTDDEAGYGAFMPCYMPSMGLSIKINTNFRNNAELGLPRILGLLILLDTETGMPLAIMDSTAITAYRTAAVSGLAIRCLSREDAEVLGILGSGVLAIPHIIAAHAVRQIRTVRIYSPHLLAREREFIAAAHASSGLIVEVVRSAEQAVSGADVLITCTSSFEPVLDGRWLEAGTCIVAVGNANPHFRELDTLTVIRSRVICDSWRACILEAGDLVIPLKEGSITDGHIKHDLSEILEGDEHSFPEQLTLFKSVGLAFEDLMAARYVYLKAKASGTAGQFNFSDAYMKVVN